MSGRVPAGDGLLSGSKAGDEVWIVLGRSNCQYLWMKIV
jgi:hypothetical protein